MLGRLVKIFLPIILGLALLVTGLVAVVGSTSATGDWGDDWNECEDWDEWDWWDWDEDWNEDCEEPSPSPSPEPCPTPTVDTEPEWINDNHYDNGKPSPSPCPSPSPEPSPSPSPTPPTGGPGGEPTGGGEPGPACPVDGLPQKVDQVWFTDIKPGQVTVHWANKGDAQGYHIAYGTKPGEWLWGVEVGNVDQFTIGGLPEGDIWFTVIPLGDRKCPGPQSEPVKVGQVLAAVGTAESRLLFGAGFSLVALGLWQAQRSLTRRELVS